MASNSEKTIGKAIGNAETFFKIVETFTDFTPMEPTETVAGLGILITEARALDEAEAGALSNYIESTDLRRNLFVKHPDSLDKRYADINGAVRSQYKTKSTQYKMVSAKIAQLRGNALPKKDPAKPDEVHHSQSQKSYDSIVQGFSDIIGYLKSFSTPYAPNNARVSIATLTTLRDNLTLASVTITTTITEHKRALKKRDIKLAELKALATSLKEDVRGQYGFNSLEFKLVKGIAL